MKVLDRELERTPANIYVPPVPVPLPPFLSPVDFPSASVKNLTLLGISNCLQPVQFKSTRVEPKTCYEIFKQSEGGDFGMLGWLKLSS